MVETLKTIKQHLEARNLPAGQRDTLVNGCFTFLGCSHVSKKKDPGNSMAAEDEGSFLQNMKLSLMRCSAGAEGEEANLKKRAQSRKELPWASKRGAADGKGIGGIDGGTRTKRARRS
jgi:hypothetical protein